MPNPIRGRVDPQAVGKSCERCHGSGAWCVGLRDEHVLCFECATAWCSRPGAPKPLYSFSSDKWERDLIDFINKKEITKTMICVNARECKKMGGYKDCRAIENHKQGFDCFGLCPKRDFSAYCIEVK